jgi:predicted XRE-type DNA-binding protein
MTYDEALEFFAEHGNVAHDIDRLRNTVPTRQQLMEAVGYAVDVKGQPKELAQEAALAVANQMELIELSRN